MSLERLLPRLADPDTSAVTTLRHIVDWLRPRRWESAEAAESRITGLAVVLEGRPELHAALAGKLGAWLRDGRFFHLFTSAGIYSRRGFLKEMGERVYERLNPSPADPENVKDVMFMVFTRKVDAEWVPQVSDAAWLKLLATLFSFSEDDRVQMRDEMQEELLASLELLGIWVAAEELEPAILRLDHKMLDRDSALVALQRELAIYVRQYPLWVSGQIDDLHDDAHARVLLEQCVVEVARLRRRTVNMGTTVALTHMLERLVQTLNRIEQLLDLLHPADRDTLKEKSVALFKQCVGYTAARHSVRALWQQNSRLLARSMTENASHTGDHYIAGSRRAYFAMLASGAGGGFIIAFMALLKIQILERGFEPFLQTVLVSLNYGLGFVLIHMMHGTVATKQPAMTAARIAERVEQGERGRADPRPLAELLVKVGRTQLVAILGNVTVAVTVAMLVAAAYFHFQGEALISPERQQYMLGGIHPWLSPALFYAAVAGVWLFLSGLIAGFFDNRAAYLNLEERLLHHPLLKRLLPRSGREAVAEYLSHNYGALASNFIFGVMLGSTGAIGHALGLPIDIRHVAFSSADVGYAMGSAQAGIGAIALGVGCALLIGLVNLAVSFSLALSMALRARGTRISSPGKLLKAYFSAIRAHPLALVFPPPTAPADDEQQPAADGANAGNSQNVNKPTEADSGSAGPSA